MLCYVFKVRSSKYLSKRDAKQKIGYNVALVALEGAKFHLETFIDNKDDIFFLLDFSRITLSEIIPFNILQ